MTRSNILYLVVGALAVAVAVLGYQLYQDRKKPEGVNINLGPGGISNTLQMSGSDACNVTITPPTPAIMPMSVFRLPPDSLPQCFSANIRPRSAHRHAPPRSPRPHPN